MHTHNYKIKEDTVTLFIAHDIDKYLKKIFHHIDFSFNTLG